MLRGHAVHPARVVFSIITAWLLASCGLILGLDEFSNSDSPPGEGGAGASIAPSTTGGGGLTQCDADEVCAVAPANAVYVTVGSSCGEGTSALGDLLDCTQCGCESSCEVTGYISSSAANCTNSVAEIAFSAIVSCVEVTALNPPIHTRGTVTPHCTARLNAPAPRACQLDEPKACASGGACIPREHGCLLVAESDDCPVEYDHERNVHLLAEQDGPDSPETRAAACGCDCNASAVTCPNEFIAYGTEDCSGPSQSIPATAQCSQTQLTTISFAASIKPHAPSGTCMPAASTPTATPRKLCCRP
ncbi:uncharacterized protein CMC5_066160 [Chondromyces crocatus]|uniref:Uncharacterized protein n=1 Tax=Chondromyces crocatus TaxID=52 RepID=A0A0K1EN85_CHOCO|nr:uncharacterized protein CMC5_066160 [Chondromyces crocatus]